MCKKETPDFIPDSRNTTIQSEKVSPMIISSSLWGCLSPSTKKVKFKLQNDDLRRRMSFKKMRDIFSYVKSKTDHQFYIAWKYCKYVSIPTFVFFSFLQFVILCIHISHVLCSMNSQIFVFPASEILCSVRPSYIIICLPLPN